MCVCARARGQGADGRRNGSAVQRREGVCLFARVRFDPLEHLERDEPADLNATAAIVDLKVTKGFSDYSSTANAFRKTQSGRLRPTGPQAQCREGRALKGPLGQGHGEEGKEQLCASLAASLAACAFGTAAIECC